MSVIINTSWIDVLNPAHLGGMQRRTHDLWRRCPRIAGAVALVANGLTAGRAWADGAHLLSAAATAEQADFSNARLGAGGWLSYRFRSSGGYQVGVEGGLGWSR